MFSSLIISSSFITITLQVTSPSLFNSQFSIFMFVLLCFSSSFPVFLPVLFLYHAPLLYVFIFLPVLIIYILSQAAFSREDDFVCLFFWSSWKPSLSYLFIHLIHFPQSSFIRFNFTYFPLSFSQYVIKIDSSLSYSFLLLH